MFGKKKRDQNPEEYEDYSAEAGYEPLYEDAQNPEAYGPGEDGAGFDAPGYDGYDENYGGQGSGWAEDDEEYEYEEEPDEKPEPRSIFRPETRKPNFVVSVLLNTIRVLIVLVILAGVAGLGALAGIAKG